MSLKSSKNSVDNIKQAIDGLLKQFPQVNDPLNNEINVESFVEEWFQKSFSDNEDISVRSSLIEIASKRLLYQYSNDNDMFLICSLLDAAYYMGRTSKCEASLAYLLIEDLFDIQTTNSCQIFWPYMESREKKLAHNLTGTRAPGTTLIRLCNSLVKRLSKNHDAQFSGRIATYLSRAFLLNEKSGLNIRGSFNTENVTQYEGSNESQLEKDEQDVEMTDGAEEDPSETTNSNNHNKKEKGTNMQILPQNNTADSTYNAFWELQEYFSNPTLLFEEQNMVKCQHLLRIVAETLKTAYHNGHRSRSAPIKSVNMLKNRNIKQERDECEGVDNEDDAYSVFIPKWLTQRDLFDLQLKDSTFRLSILSQISILCDFMLSLGRESKDKWENIKAINKSVMFPFTLSEEDEKFFMDISKKARDKFNDDYSRTFNFVLNRDKTWQMWKLRNCPSFEEPKLESTEFDLAIRKLQEFKIPRKRFWHSMGTAALSKLWKVETGIEKLQNSERFTVPDSEYYFKKLQQHKEKQKSNSNDGDEVTGDMDIANSDELDFNASITWRGLRAARDHGLWLQFGKVNKKDGFGGLFGITQEEPQKEDQDSNKKESEVSNGQDIDITEVEERNMTKQNGSEITIEKNFDSSEEVTNDIADQLIEELGPDEQQKILDTTHENDSRSEFKDEQENDSRSEFKDKQENELKQVSDSKLEMQHEPVSKNEVDPNSESSSVIETKFKHKIEPEKDSEIQHEKINEHSEGVESVKRQKTDESHNVN